jgi:hypothetical protein
MKKSDFASIILIASISALVAWFSANAIIGEPKQNALKVKSADVISAEVEAPDKRIFKADAINPTVERSIGKSANSLPFN